MFFFFSSRRRHTRYWRDWSSDVCSSDLGHAAGGAVLRMTAVRLRDARIGYGDVAVVEGVDLAVADGEAVAVLGSNGSGKTTLARGLLGLATVLGGEVEVLGAPVGRLRRPPPAQRGRIGYVPQRHTVSGAVPATGREVVGGGRLARLDWKSTRLNSSHANISYAV